MEDGCGPEPASRQTLFSIPLQLSPAFGFQYEPAEVGVDVFHRAKAILLRKDALRGPKRTSHFCEVVADSRRARSVAVLPKRVGWRFIINVQNCGALNREVAVLNWVKNRGNKATVHPFTI